MTAPLVHLLGHASPGLATFADHTAAHGRFDGAAFMVSVGAALLLICVLEAIAYARRIVQRIGNRRRESKFQGAIRLRDLLLAESQQPIIVLGPDLEAPIAYGEGGRLLSQCLEGQGATRLAGLIDSLLNHGTPFETRCHIHGPRGVVLVRGTPAGRTAALFFRKLELREGEVDFEGALHALPTPIWLRDRDLALSWANQAFLDTVQASSVEDAIRADARIERSERDLAVIARDGTPVNNVRRYATIAGQHRAVSIAINRLPDLSLVGMSVDVTDAVKEESRLTLHLEACAGLLDRIPLAMANFGADRRLSQFNSAYVQLWCLDERWLRTRPRIDEILDRLRASGRLPEQRDFRKWKDKHLSAFADASRYTEEIWHTSGERSIKVQAQPILEGGVFFLFEDVSERLRLTGRLALLGKVQRATLDTIDDGIAIFDPDGRLAMHNSAFARSWDLAEEELAAAPHHSALAALCHARMGHDGLWDMVSVALNAGEPDGYGEWGKVTRADGRILSLSMSRLPNGAIVAMFKDLTDLERFSEAFSESSPAAA